MKGIKENLSESSSPWTKLKSYFLKHDIKNTNFDRMGGKRKGNPLTLLVGMQTSTATMRNSVEIP